MNQFGLSPSAQLAVYCVLVLAVEGTRLRVADLDILDGNRTCHRPN